jgi:hypothetical protein
MEDQNEIINKVANSALVTFDLEELHQPGERVLIDIKDQLFQELILREKDFREFIKSTDWSVYKNKFVAITCSADAIVPTWAYLLLTIALEPHSKLIVFGTLLDLEERLYQDSLSTVDWQKYEGAKIVVKGCSKVEVPEAAYVEVVRRLRSHASSLMFGEPCSTVPLYKKR